MTSITSRFCSICLDTKSTNLFNCLPCFHWFCRNCLSKLVQNVCPLCRFPFENEPSFSNPINIGILSRSAPTAGVGRLPLYSGPILSRSVDSTTRDLETLVNFTGIQNVDSLSQVLTDLEVRERSQYRRRQRRHRPSRPPSPPTPPSPQWSAIFQFDDGSSDDSKSDDSLDEENPSEPKRRRHWRRDRWAYLNRQRAHRSGR